MRLKYQFFITLLLASAFLIVILFLVNNWSLKRGFIDHLNRSKEARLENYAALLSTQYQEHDQSWEWLAEDPAAWRQIIRAGPRRERPPDSDINGIEPVFTTPPIRSREGTAGPRYILQDAERTTLIGRWSEKDSMLWQSIKSDGAVIGYIGVPRETRIASKLDRAFTAQQTSSLAYTALIMGLLCAVVSIPLASRIVRPVLELNTAVKRISEGDLTHRIESDRADELGDLSRQINQLALNLNEQQQLRQRWITEIAHELRTPVAILQSEIEALQDGVTVATSDALASLHSETEKLTRLIEDLRELMVLNSGALQYRYRPLMLDQLISQRVEATKGLFTQQQLSLTVTVSDDPLMIVGDAQRLEQLIDNLSQNSLRYTNQNGTVRVDVLRQQDQVCVRWSDSWPGVPNDQLSRIFEPLYRVESSRNRSFGGSGLGLSIAKKIVEAHKGRIMANHSSLGGLEITMLFPLASEDTVLVESDHQNDRPVS